VAVANATLVIYVNLGEGFWADYVDSKLIITPSTEIELGIFDTTGQTQPGSLALGLTEGEGSMDASGMVANQGIAAMMKDDELAAEGLGLQNPFIAMEIPSLTNAGMLLRSIIFHCDAPGDVTIAIVDDNGEILDSQVIHQVPEPMTIALLGLGSLVLVKFRKH